MLQLIPKKRERAREREECVLPKEFSSRVFSLTEPCVKIGFFHFASPSSLLGSSSTMTKAEEAAFLLPSRSL